MDVELLVLFHVSVDSERFESARKKRRNQSANQPSPLSTSTYRADCPVDGVQLVGGQVLFPYSWRTVETDRERVGLLRPTNP